MRRWRYRHKETHPFYHTKAWKLARAERLATDNYLCQPCFRKSVLAPATLVHHIEPIETHPELGLEQGNLESQCAACHNLAHPEKRQRKDKPEATSRRARVIKV